MDIRITLACSALESDFNAHIAMPIQSVTNVGIPMQAIGFTLETHWHAHELELEFNVHIAMPIQLNYNAGIPMRTIMFTLESHWRATH